MELPEVREEISFRASVLVNAARKFCAADGRRLSSDCALRPTRSPETALFHIGMLLALQKSQPTGNMCVLFHNEAKKQATSQMREEIIR